MPATALLIAMLASISLLSGCSKSNESPTTTSDSTTAASSSSSAAPLKVGYSDWPGWVAWQVAIEKGWIKEAGLNVDFQWFDYSASLSAFAAGKLDGVLVTNGDNLVNASSGSRGIIILATDYSSGNDMIIGKKGINSLADLKGKTVAVEKGLVDHLLLNTALAKNNIAPDSITLLNAPTNEMPQVLASGKVDAVAVWQPVAGQALKAVAGSKALYTSADAPGLIYDTLAVSPSSLGQHRADWVKLSKVWDKVVHYINDPKTQPDALKIMSARVGLEPAAYAEFLNGTHLLDLEGNKGVMVKKDGLDSLYGSSYNVNKFNVDNGIYNKPVNVDSLIDPSVVNAK
ncbi:ABC transporter substrate-binding protein [Alkanindiges illinoisensis]|uniref:ABC transporter substrate-binding protein n=1 Tax=Alkanindiges illinoisensis TaxID=197183 RepID=UPI00047CACC8